MKQCSLCNRVYNDETLNFCLEDGTILSALFDSEATIVKGNDSIVTLPFQKFSSQPRTLRFSDYNWQVKSSRERIGPGPNKFSDSQENVWLDELGQLHLRITLRNGSWYCAEVVCNENFGYGKYIFFLTSRIDVLDPNTVLGLFTWDNDAPENNYREIDIEFAKWGDRKAENSQFVIQPWEKPENVNRFNIQLEGDYTTHIIDWSPRQIHFQSIHGHYQTPPKGHLIKEWFYEGNDVPTNGKENAHINFWLHQGRQPENLNETEVIIKGFQFIPQTN